MELEITDVQNWTTFILICFLTILFFYENEHVTKIVVTICVIICFIKFGFFLNNSIKDYLYELSVNNLLFMEDQLQEDIRMILDDL